MHACSFTGWMVVNTGIIPFVRAFDPYPYSFLTFVSMYVGGRVPLSIHSESEKKKKKKKKPEFLT